MNDSAPKTAKAHSLSVDNRERAVMTGVEDVDMFNEQMVVALTSRGSVTVVGQDLHVETLDLSEGRLVITGVVVAVEYDERAPKGKGALKKLFR